MSDLSLSDLFSFTAFLNSFQKIKRTIYLPGTTLQENDIEHSYHIAMLAWYIAGVSAPHLDKEKLLRYALIHDLVEVYAGDTFLYDTDSEVHASKNKREQDAALQIEKEFPHFTELHQSIKEYESRNDDESTFIYALDKIHPILQIYLDEGKLWREKGITLTMLLEKKNEKVRLSKELTPYWEELVSLLKEGEEKLFN